jgi:hypothetical protein
LRGFSVFLFSALLLAGCVSFVFFIFTCDEEGEGREAGSSYFGFCWLLVEVEFFFRFPGGGGGKPIDNVRSIIIIFFFFQLSSSPTALLTVSLSVTDALATRPPLARRRSVGAMGAARAERGWERRRVVCFALSLFPCLCRRSSRAKEEKKK